MKFKINRDHFSAGLQLVSSVVGSRKTMPILQNVLIEAKEDSVSLSTTNLDLGMKCSIVATIEEVGSVTLPVKELGRIIRELADMEVNVTSTGTPKATISTRGSIFNIIGMDSKEFPPLPELENSKNFTLAKDELTSMLKSVSYAQSVNEERYMLKGVFFQINETDISLVATDGRRLAVTSKQEKRKAENKGEFILPSLTVAELERLPGVAKNIELNFTDRQVSLKMDVSQGNKETNGFHDSIYLVSKVVEGKYPNFNQVIPKDDFNQAIIERELMLECVNRAALVSDEKVTLRVKPNEMEIFGQSTLGDASESMSIEYSGPDSVVSFNPKFLLDPLKSIASDKVIFEFRDDMSPGVFKVKPDNSEGNDFLCVVMPIRTD
ncbi:DNA polymerase III subunit beta [Opitutales bacterium]|jgi:DNA polymerase III subunit beta|uniref:DNA polymerase III subunit beta n=1 Tax=Candidatus Chordibacter forsetii TaxID=3381758 RepID=UPI00231AE2C1|nr:DNA polymerase III subunit beta [Opitutales bacterium]MDA8805924.1 DNA polymerase III subunit beta [Opitutales bacterium]MDB3958765.1 DNA polymerase III subunit beta [Opitutales bacterium]